MSKASNVRLRQDAPNRATVTIGDLDLMFSYETVVAFRTPEDGLVVSENVWSTTTGKHLAAIDGGKTGGRWDQRRLHAEFTEALDEALMRRGLER